MKNANKSHLFLVGMLSLANVLMASEPVLEINFEDGATMAGPVTGGADFKGTSNCTFTSTATGNVAITNGNVKVSSAASFGSGVLIFKDDGSGGVRSLEATAAMTLPILTMNAPATIIADADVLLVSVVGGSDLTFNGVGMCTPIANLSASTSNVNMNSTGGLNITSTANKLPTGKIAISADSFVTFAPGLKVNEGSVAAPGQWNIASGSTIKLGNRASMAFDPHVH